MLRILIIIALSIVINHSEAIDFRIRRIQNQKLVRESFGQNDYRRMPNPADFHHLPSIPETEAGIISKKRYKRQNVLNWTINLEEIEKNERIFQKLAEDKKKFEEMDDKISKLGPIKFDTYEVPTYPPTLKKSDIQLIFYLFALVTAFIAAVGGIIVIGGIIRECKKKCANRG